MNITKAMVEIRAKTFIDSYDAEIIEGILQNALNDLNEYYEEEYCNAVASARSRAYDAGYDAGYAACESSLDGEKL